MAIKLNKREKISVAAAAAAIVIFLLIAVSGFPPVRRKRPVIQDAFHPPTGIGSDPAAAGRIPQNGRKRPSRRNGI
jgi:hypothetical protein